MIDVDLDLQVIAGLRYPDEHYSCMRGGTESSECLRDKSRENERKSFVEGGKFAIEVIESVIDKYRSPEHSRFIDELEETIIKLKR